MKISLIIIFLISYSICEVFYLKKYGSIQTSDSSGIVYLNANSFEKNDDIHFVFRANNGQMNKKIYYEFCDDEPTSTFSPKYSLDTTFSDKNSDDSDYSSNYVNNYYYEIRKKIDKKYLIMKYLNFMSSDNGYLIIENTHFNSNYYIIIIVVVIAILIIIVVVGYIMKVKLEEQESQIMELEKSLTLQKEETYINNNTTPYDNYQ